MSQLRVACLVSVLLTGAACAPVSKEDGGAVPIPFSYSSFGETAYDIRVVDSVGNPLSGVSVSVANVYVRDLDDDSDEDVEVFASGLTDSSGKLLGSLRLPNGVTQVDVIIDDEDKTGPWTDTSLKTDLGDFGPSSRQTYSIDTNSLVLTIVLENA